MPEEMDKAVKNNFYGLEKPYVALLVVEPKDYQDAMVSLMRFLVESEKFSLTYITLNKSCVKWDEIFRVKGINTDNVFFIDAISKVTNQAVRDSERVKYISSPDNTKAIMDEVSAISEKPVKGMAFVVDNVSAMLVYNSPDNVNRFLHFLYGKAELTNTSAVLVTLAGDNVPKTIGQYTDRIIEIKYVY